MLDFEEFKKYFSHLPVISQENLFKDLEQFPPQIDHRLFSTRFSEATDIFQGDGLRDMPFVDLPDSEILTGPVMIVSNTCDTSFQNPRKLSPYVIYCPIVQLEQYAQVHLEAGLPKAGLDDWLNGIRAQRFTRLFFLPKFGGLPADCVALLDQLSSCRLIDYVTPESVPARRLFGLSDLGNYLFILKLAIHFLRPTPIESEST